MEGDPVVGNAWDIHQVWVGGVWGQVGEVSRADEVRPVGCEAVKLWDTGMAFLWSVVYRPVAHQRCHILIPRTCECVT